MSAYPTVGHRHLFAFLVAAAILSIYTTRSSLSVTLVAMMKSNVSDTHSPTVGETFAWSRQLQGFILSAYFWGYVVLQVPGGMAARHFGGKWVLAFGVGSIVVFNLLTPTAARLSPYLMITVMFLEGVGSSVTFPAMYDMLGRWAPPLESSTLTSICVVGGAMGGEVIGFLFAGPVCTSEALGGWPSVFYINFAIGLFGLTVWCIFARNSPADSPWISEEERQYIEDSIGPAEKKVSDDQKGTPWKALLISRVSLVFYVVSFAYGWLNYGSLTCLPQFLSDVLLLSTNHTSLVVGLLYIPRAFTCIIFTIASDFLLRCCSKTVVRKLFTVAGFWSFAGSAVALTFVENNVIVSAVLLCLGVTLLEMKQAGFILTPLDVFREYSGTSAALCNLIETIGGIVAPIAIDHLTASGNVKTAWNEVFFLLAGIGFFPGLLYLLCGSAEEYDWKQEGTEKSPLLERTGLLRLWRTRKEKERDGE